MLLRVVKPLKYNRRDMVAGDEFEPLTSNHGKLLLATKKVVRSVERKPGKLAPPSQNARQTLKAATAAAPDSTKGNAADAAGAGQAAIAPDTNAPVHAVAIAADWKDMHWTQQVKLAEALNGGDLAPAEGETKATKAVSIIEAEVSRRAVKA